MAFLTAGALIHFRTATGILLSKTYFVRTFPRYKNFDLIALRIQGTFDGEELDGDATRFEAAKLVSGGSFLHLPISGHRGFRKIWHLSPWVFSIQPTIWRKSSFEQLVGLHEGQTIWEFETKAQRTVRKLRLETLSPKRAKNKRGRYHWDNPIYPVISTAISKGKWVFSEYESELPQILSSYGIDPSVRGTI
jgi:hypothetical protein